MKFIDRFLNNITMYRLMLYGLLALALIAVAFGFAGFVPYSGLSLLTSLIVLFAASYFVNLALSILFKANTSTESAYITGLILFFILAPTSLGSIGILVLAATLAQLSKYVLAWKKRHIFNPAAVAALILTISGSSIAVWWVGSAVLAPFALILGLLVVRKLRRFHLLWAFLVPSVAILLFVGLRAGTSLGTYLPILATSWPIVFFSTIMLTEPYTTPPTRTLRIAYGILVGVLFALPLHIGPVYATPQLALILGNIFSYIVSSKERLALRLLKKEKHGEGVYHFVFAAEGGADFTFTPGQYLEWTLPHEKADLRGNRRYFTIASSPTEDGLHLGTRIAESPDKMSSFKRMLSSLPENGEALISATGLAGEFTLPKDAGEKVAWIAGGIGITPYRSMTKYLLDKGEARDAVLLYSAANEDDFAYTDIFDDAVKRLGMKVVYIPTEPKRESWQGRKGFVTAEMLQEEVPDWRERTFYLSGPNVMVESYKKLLRGLGVPRSRIRIDYFPGL